MASNTFEPFGFGIVCPFQRDGKGDFAAAGGARLIASDIGELIGVMGPTRTRPGELPWNTDVGSSLQTLRHRHSHSEMVRAMAETMTAGVVRAYEKRVRVGPCLVQTDGDGTSLTIRFTYTPLGSRQDPVFVDRAVQE